MWLLNLLPDALRRAFLPPPPDPIWKWAEREVWLDNKDAAEPGYYRSAKTPWTKRLQEVAKNPFRWIFVPAESAKPEEIHELIPSKRAAGYWKRYRVGEFSVQKSSQSGFSEAVLNAIRWFAKWRPRNVIYAIDTKEEARNISDRLTPTLKSIDADMFTGDDNDEGTFLLRMRAMVIWFFGSFSTGKFANKQSPFVVIDEYEEHGQQKGDTTTGQNLDSRKKTAANGLLVILSKPKLENGPINKAVKQGSQEQFHVPCPHCNKMQFLTFSNDPRVEKWESVYEEEPEEILDQDGNHLGWGFIPLPLGKRRAIKLGRVVFDHCKNALDEWDQLRILEDTYYECAHCQGKIRDHHKPWMTARGEWYPLALGSPDVISQYCSDLLSMDSESTFGKIAKQYVVAKKKGRVELQGVINHRFGKAFREEANKTDENTILANIVGQEGDTIDPYNRGKLSFKPWNLILGGDVGLNYARWVVIAVLPNERDIAVLDWGEEIDPQAVAEVMMKIRWPGLENKTYRAAHGFLDAKYRQKAVYEACRRVPGRILHPAAGIGGAAAKSVRLYGWTQIPSFPKGFCQFVYNDREAKNELYVEGLAKKKFRVYLPADVMKYPEFVAELCGEELREEDGKFVWETVGPNHYGDSLKDALNGLRFLTRRALPEDPEGEQPAAPHRQL